MIRVLLVDDHTSFRQALAFMMDREPDITITAQAGSLAEGRRVVDGVDVAVVDLELPDGNGTELVQELRAANPESLVLILTAAGNPVQLARAVEAGASGVLHKSAGISEVITAVRRLHEGEQLLSRREVIEMLNLLGEQREQNREAAAALARLTKREHEVLQALADGLNDKDIADRLSISGETARSHMVKILSKLGVNSRLQALVFAVRHGAVKIT